MKYYIVYVDGVEVLGYVVDGEVQGYVKAASHNAAEKKAQKLYPGRNVSVAYIEVV